MNNDHFISVLISFVEKEQKVQNQQIITTWNQKLDKRVKLGEAIGGAIALDSLTTARGVKLRRFRIPMNRSKFRVGDYLRLHQGNVFAPDCYVMIYDEDGDDFFLQENQFKTKYLFEIASGTKVQLDRDTSDVSRIVTDAFQNWAASEKFSEVLATVQGKRVPDFDVELLRVATEYADGIPFNSRQRAAFIHAAATKNFYVVQGPPGTGKTFLLAHLANFFALRGEKVLISSLTHRAINNALIGIGKKMGHEQILKVGDHYRSDGLTWEHGAIRNIERIDTKRYNENGGGVILGGTIFHLHTKRLGGIVFDTIIFDEAGQINQALGILGMFAGNRSIFVGDHQQMSPVVQGEGYEPWVRNSIFESIFNHHPGTMLNVTFRMNDQITKFPSDEFYRSELKCFDENRGKRIKIGETNSEALCADESLVFVAVPHTEDEMRSEAEAEYIAQQIEAAIGAGVPCHEIAVITPFRAQARVVRQAIGPRIDAELSKHIVIDTVERIQGQERELIFISLVCSAPKFIQTNAEFIFQPNRLNVAISRAKNKVVLVASPTLFDVHLKDERHRTWQAHYRNYVAISKVLQA